MLSSFEALTWGFVLLATGMGCFIFGPRVVDFFIARSSTWTDPVAMKYAREYRRYEKVYKFFFRAGGVFACLMGFAGLVSGLTSFV